MTKKNRKRSACAVTTQVKGYTIMRYHNMKSLQLVPEMSSGVQRFSVIGVWGIRIACSLTHGYLLGVEGLKLLEKLGKHE